VWKREAAVHRHILDRINAINDSLINKKSRSPACGSDEAQAWSNTPLDQRGQPRECAHPGYTMAAAGARADWKTSILAGYIPGKKGQRHPGYPHGEEDFPHYRV